MVNQLTTKLEVADLLGLDPDDLQEDRINRLIQMSQREVLSDIATKIVDGGVTGSVDGGNKEYKVDMAPIADSNFDNSVNENDITMYSWTDLDDEDTKVQLTVSSINGETGWVKLSTAPATVSLTADYWYLNYYLQDGAMSDLVTVRTAYRVVASEYYLLPERYTLGGFRIGHRHPQLKLQKDYEDLLNKVRSIPLRHTKKPYARTIDRLNWAPR
jgi:hypothetical protein